MKHNEIKSNNGFTLIELLVVVLIIGILSAVALPMYRKAVESSKVADALTTMQAVAKSEHGWYLTNNSYTKDFANLDIDLIDENGEKADGESYETANYTFTLQDNNIMAERNNGEYTLYKLYEDPNIYCLPQENEICQQFGWGVNKSLCSGINGFWSNKTNACYNSEEDWCVAIADPDDNNPATYQTINNLSFCGYAGNNYANLGENQVCYATGSNCYYSTFSGKGALCTGWTGANVKCSYSYFENEAECNAGNSYACNNSTFTAYSTCTGTQQYGCTSSLFESGSVCVGEGYGACQHGTFKDNSKCIANGSIACWNSTFEGTGCCEGPSCPKNSPKCNCDIDPNTGKHLTSC